MIIKITEGKTDGIAMLSDNNQSQEVVCVQGDWLRPYEGVIYNPTKDYVDNLRVEELSKAIVLYGNVQQEDVEIQAGDNLLVPYAAINDATPIPGTEHHFIDKHEVVAFERNGQHTSVNGWLVGILPNADELSTQGHIGRETPAIIKLLCGANYTKGMIMEPHFVPNTFEVGDYLLVDGKKIVNMSWLGHTIFGHSDVVAIQKIYVYGKAKQ